MYYDNFEGYALGATVPFGNFTGGAGGIIVANNYPSRPGSQALQTLSGGARSAVYANGSAVSSATIYVAVNFTLGTTGTFLRAVNGSVATFDLYLQPDATFSAVSNGVFGANSLDFSFHPGSLSWYWMQVDLTYSTYGAGLLRVGYTVSVAGIVRITGSIDTGITVAGLPTPSATFDGISFNNDTIVDEFTFTTIQSDPSYPNPGAPTARASTALAEVVEAPTSAHIRVSTGLIELLLSTPLTLTCPVGGGSVRVGAPYSKTLVRSNGTGPFTFAIISGSLPPGLTLNTATGEISGIPLVGGDYTYTAQVTDALGATATTGGGCTISVNASGLSRGMSILTAKQFSELREKGLVGMPTDIYLDQAYPNAGFHVWPIPSLDWIIEFYYWAVLQQFAAVTDTLSIPPAYYDALVLNLALALCPSYRRQVPPSILALAANATKTIEEINGQILSGSYHISRTLDGPNEGEPRPAALGPPQPRLLPGSSGE